MLQVEVCFLRFPPGFPAVPPYFNHTSVGPGPSQNREGGHRAERALLFYSCLWGPSYPADSPKEKAAKEVF